MSIPMPVSDAPIPVAAIHPLKFHIRYLERKVADKDNPTVLKTVTVPVEWCDWAKKGVERPVTGGDAIARLKKDPSMWAAIEPYYKNWKSGGTDEVVNGLPLTVWAGITPEMADMLRPYRIYSVEDLAIMSDGVMQKIPHPDIVRVPSRKARNWRGATPGKSSSRKPPSRRPRPKPSPPRSLPTSTASLTRPCSTAPGNVMSTGRSTRRNGSSRSRF
jgi:hypothetical protein